MKNFRTIFLLVLMVNVVLFFGCKKENKSHLLNLTAYTLVPLEPENEILYVTLIHAYRMKESSIKTQTNVNLFVCKQLYGIDSIFIFDTSSQPDKFLFELANQNQGLIINRSNIKNSKIKSVVVNVPLGFKIPKKIDYLFGRLERMQD